MQILIAILALPATALLALGTSNKERFWGNLLALLAAPLWLIQEGRHGQWLLMAVTAGAIAAHALGIWQLIQPKPSPPHPITIEVLERERGRMPLELRIFVVDVCLGLWTEAVVGE